MARKVRKDRGRKDRRVHRVHRVRCDTLCVSSVRIAGREALAEPLRFADPNVRLEAVLGSLEIWKLLRRWLEWTGHSQVHDTNRVVPVPPGFRPTRGFGLDPAPAGKAGQRCYHSRLHSEIVRRSLEEVLPHCFEELVRCNSGWAVRSAAFPRSDLAPQTAAGTSEEFPVGLSDVPPPKATAAESLHEDGESAKRSFSAALLAAQKLAAWACCSVSQHHSRCHDGLRFGEEDNR